MSLDTVLKIGKIYRSSNLSLEKHDLIKSAQNDVQPLKKYKNSEGKSLSEVYYELPVIDLGETFVFDFDNLSTVTSVDKQLKIKCLQFKSSKRDTEMKYLFGDITYATYTEKGGVAKEGGIYRMANSKKGSSFTRANEDAVSLASTIIGKFRQAYLSNIDSIERILQRHDIVILHFSFPNETMWYELSGVLNLIDQKLASGFIAQDIKTQKFYLDNFLFKTIGGSGVNPNFNETKGYKIKSFDNLDSIVDLIYGVKTADRALINIRDFGIVVLPNLYLGETPDFDHIANILDSFLQKKSLIEVSEGEETLDTENRELQKGTQDTDSMFGDLINNELPEDVKYDLVFMKLSQGSSPPVDMLEISSIAKSKLREIHEAIVAKKNALRLQSDAELVDNKGNKLKLQPKYDIRASFLEILGQKGKNQKKYSFHLLKVLPQIYTDTYYQDPILLPALIEKTERNIRDDFANFNILKYEFQFLTQIQKADTMNAITNSKSYAMGIALGKMARPFAPWRKDCPIKSFEANYVGNLSKRITNLNDLMKLSNFMNEKLSMHKIAYKEQKQAYVDLMASFKALNELNEKYDRNASALGFFESYFNQADSKAEFETETETQNQQ